MITALQRWGPAFTGALKVFVAAMILLIAACSSVAPSSQSGLSSAAGNEPVPAAGDALVGTWTRTQDCAGQLSAFKEAGLAESHLAWVTGNWFPEGREPALDDPCEGSRPAEEHSHFFTGSGMFGSGDAQGRHVDDGDYLVVDDDTLSFPSHAAEFGYGGDVLVDFAVEGDSARFAIEMPASWEDACADAYAWALSAFYEADAWHRD